VFHISCLNKVVGQFISTSKEISPLYEEGRLELVPKELLEFIEQILRSSITRECLFIWRGISVEDATWDSDRILQHPGLMLHEDKKYIEGSILMSLSK
jgi:hypothetical protein